MDDLINGRTLEEIITGLKCEVTCSECAYRDHNFMKDDSCSYYVEQDIIALIQRLEAERDAALANVPKWISVKERLPEKAGRYLVCAFNRYDNDGQITAAYYQFGARFHLVDLYEVTHYMPLPEPPEEEG